uniref:U2A'/phosphoprotein 32 family A C-terminal domain-containing protein n=1 Tax=Chromera velia CCMP2878 TaxID=1169474 RepID=A0A0G4HPE4_9ALVE|mmetsp:Transcript_21525/g.42727  ORF Transcript_21525/g.42727 Transcript_21525/m.42727 type:complete len:284 (+) Transcript_21525:313-1164(+)|eukprot:Cvel_7793.t1-p1 / transcript=Cvel_7793.t1 / gene=Cvel_7793 / organism=Chromera_velia_CCMP2878 / gene_product=Probable U2 small nuclear ribonucleoprotein A', putative / transcript_product=Probable U2 small nuclear ribonucleoprotein A', putative / location=Cvel_scaffold415:61041-66000(-) / protein_length=283 / sequence_SO=supercontig / SO=protein_coding / is_pseudo=false
MRITLNVLENAPQCWSPCRERTLILRGIKIPAIENLGTTNDFFECIDMSDNDIQRLGNLPPLKMLKTLILTNNRLNRIADDVMESVPNLVALVLSQNNLSTLGDLLPLKKAPRCFERISLVDNPVSKLEHFRPFLIHLVPSLRFINFQRVTLKEREEAKKLFEGEKPEVDIAKIAIPRSAQAPEPGIDADVNMGILNGSGGSGAAPSPMTNGTGPPPAPPLIAAARSLSQEDIDRIKKAIMEATTIEDVRRLERALQQGILPDDLKGGVKRARTEGGGAGTQG